MNEQTSPVRRSLIWLTTAALGLGLAVGPAQAATSTVPHDGSRPERAAASCWEVKQQVPDAGDGTYWVQTPDLGAPLPVWCDQTTDGGGWVLVGRGRDGWSWGTEGLGTAADLASSATGPAPYRPRQLPTDTVSALLAGAKVSALTDGVRLRRATDAAGQTWQEARLRFSRQGPWSWALPAGIPLTSATTLTRPGQAEPSASPALEGGKDAQGRTVRLSTRQVQLGTTGWDRLRSDARASDGYVRGFHGGVGATAGSTNDSFTYSQATGGDEAVGFTQVWLRPRLTQTSRTYPKLPSSGTRATSGPAVAESAALPQSWGVAEPTDAAEREDEQYTEVQAIEPVGSRMFVGGNFPRLIKGAGGAGGSLDQPYLAAFDERTSEPITSFRPTFNGQVKALRALPDGLLAVGGEFTTVNGQPRAGLAVISATTGQLSSRWTITLQRRESTKKVSVRALDYDRGSLYVGGAFTHLLRGGKETYLRNLGRVRVEDGVPDSRWNPSMNGTVMDVDVSTKGTMVYAAGFFSTVGGKAQRRVAAFSTKTTATRKPWTGRFSTSSKATYQQAVQFAQGHVWAGGSQHSLFRYDSSKLAVRNSAITLAGGDFQEIGLGRGGSVIYAGCHCGNWVYEGADSYDQLLPDPTNDAWTRAWRMSYVAAWSTSTGELIGAFSPSLRTRLDGGHGTWALGTSSDGTLWVGGDFASVDGRDGDQWVGGFARFAPRPTTPPGAPTSLRVKDSTADATAQLRWTASATPGVTYEILRGDRVVLTTTEATATVRDARRGDRYAVRASDGRGNLSASTRLTASS